MPAKKIPAYVPHSKTKRYWFGHRLKWSAVKRIATGKYLTTKPFQLLCSNVRTRCQMRFFPKGTDEEHTESAVKFMIIESDLDSIYLGVSVFLHTIAGPFNICGEKLAEQFDPVLTTLHPHDNTDNCIMVRSRENVDKKKYARNGPIQFVFAKHLEATLKHNVEAVSARWSDGVYKSLYQNVQQLKTEDVSAPFPNMLDLEVRCEDNASFLVHRIVLAERSAVWNKMFNDDFKEKYSSVVFDNHQPKILSLFIRALYTAKLESEDLLDEELTDIADIADYYQVDRIKAEVEKILVSRVTTSSAFQLLKFADKHNCVQLKGRCMAEICHAKADIFKQNISDSSNHSLLLEIIAYDDETKSVKEQNSPGPSRKIRKSKTQNNEGSPGPSRKKTKNERQSNEGFWASSTKMQKNEKGNNEEQKFGSGACFAGIKKMQDEQDVKVWEDCLHIALQKNTMRLCGACLFLHTGQQQRLALIRTPYAHLLCNPESTLSKLGGEHICSKCKVEKEDKEIQGRLVDINQPD